MAEEMGHTANWEYDLVTNKLWGSPEGPRIYGLTPVDGEFSLEDLEACIPDRERVRQALVDLISEGKEFNLECSVIPRDGSAQKMIHTVARLEKDAQGNPIKVIGIIQDITERKFMESEIRSLNTVLEQRVKDRTEALNQANKKFTLLSSITRDDINNLLTVQMGFLEILGETQLTPSQNEYFQKINTAAKRISDMIRFTKEYEAIGIHVPVWQDCRRLVDTAAKQAPLGKVMMKNDLPAGAEMFADPLFVKVFYNLMDNAVRYGGKITTLRFSAEERDDDHFVVCEDDGVGVPADEKVKVFKRGFGKNTGLGLALSWEILSITGITIRETGEPGKGARFEMTVPKGVWRMTETDKK
jgi:signal transduction histidine kinase